MSGYDGDMNSGDMNGNADRLYELLADRATGDLLTSDASEIEGAGFNEDASFDRAAAACAEVFCAMSPEPMPASVRSRLLESWGQGGPVVGKIREGQVVSGGGARVTAWVGWFAAAAGFVLAGIGWVLYGNSSGTVGDLERQLTQAQGEIAALETQVAELRPKTTEELYNDFIADPPADLVTVSWSVAQPDEPDPSVRDFVEGTIYWSDQWQEGYMVFRGLAPNDADRERYQLWMFSQTQPAETPVDGGLFDVAADDAGGTLIVPIDAKLKVMNPSLFALTVEDPEGAVVSTRERLPLVAPVN